MCRTNLSRSCPICSEPMEYRPNRIWTGMRYTTVMHEWYCNSGMKIGVDRHHLKLYTQPTTEYVEWEKQMFIDEGESK